MTGAWVFCAGNCCINNKYDNGVNGFGGYLLGGFGEGATIGMAMAAMIFGILYATGKLSKVFASQKRLQGRE